MWQKSSYCSLGTWAQDNLDNAKGIKGIENYNQGGFNGKDLIQFPSLIEKEFRRMREFDGWSMSKSFAATEKPRRRKEPKLV